MLRSMWQVVISYLYKKGDRKDIANWHPRLLPNYDNKIYAKILASKIQATLEDLIGPEQAAAIKGRTIIENLLLNRDVMSYANTDKIQVAMIALVQEKAFDRVETKVQINGHLSQAFPIKRGVWLGCPLSMILYIIFKEIFLESLRQNNDIKGIVIGKKLLLLPMIQQYT